MEELKRVVCAHRVLLQFRLEALEQRERVRSGACKAADDVGADAPDLLHVRLDHLRAHGDLAVTDDDHLGVSDGEE